MVIIIITVMISKRDRRTHKSMSIHMTQTKTVTPVHDSTVHPSGLTPHDRQYRNFLPSQHMAMNHIYGLEAKTY